MATKPKVRVRQPGQHSLYEPESGVHMSPKIDEYYEQDHALVKAHPWAFGTDAELSEAVQVEQQRTSVPVPQVEAATANPGEKRATRRP